MQVPGSAGLLISSPIFHRSGFQNPLPPNFTGTPTNSCFYGYCLSLSRSRRCHICAAADNYKHSHTPATNGKIGAHLQGKKDNVWSVDNDAAQQSKSKLASKGRSRRVKKQKVYKNGSKTDRNLLVSSSMLVELDRVLQTQEPIIQPSWNTFVSSVSGVWNGVAAAFSPISAEMEPITVGSKNRPVYDCYTLSCIDTSSGKINRKTNWVAASLGGETPLSSPSDPLHNVDFGNSDVMEEDVMYSEPGLAFFEDGSYSRGVIEISDDDIDNSQYYLSPTFKFEQCLVKGGHKRLRIVHTIEFCDGGGDIQILRVGAYEETWASPVNVPELWDAGIGFEPFSGRVRTKPSELAGSWKVFEISASPVVEDGVELDDGGRATYVYSCTESLKRRSLPESRGTQDASVLWLPGGVTTYVDVSEDGILCIGVGWYSDDGTNLAMERNYGVDGKLLDVRYKSEVRA